MVFDFQVFGLCHLLMFKIEAKAEKIPQFDITEGATPILRILIYTKYTQKDILTILSIRRKSSFSY